MTETGVDTEQVTALFEERERYREWIATLESKRATTPEHIYNRVHADYTARLQRVVEQFATHATSLQDHEKVLMERLGAIDIEEAKHRDEAAETELRATVGELGADTQQEVRERTSAALGALNAQREQVNQELGRLRALLEAGGIPSSAPAAHRPAVEVSTPAPPAPPPVQQPVASPPPVAREHPASTTNAAAAPSDGRSDDWQLAFEKTPEPPHRATPQISQAQEANADLSVERGPEIGPFDDLEFLRSMTDSRTSGENAAVGSGAAGAAGAAAGGAQAKLSGASGGAGSSAAHASGGADPGVVHSSGEAVSPKESMAAEQVKTLKCQECGTLNYPTEWYCERCGAELAAL